VREDYFGRGADNASFFSIPIGVPGGTGPNHGRFGTLGRNTFRGPAFHNFDLSLVKETPLVHEAMKLQFRAEFFNVFNLVNFGLRRTLCLALDLAKSTVLPEHPGKFHFLGSCFIERSARNRRGRHGDPAIRSRIAGAREGNLRGLFCAHHPRVFGEPSNCRWLETAFEDL